jgi:hypothetical protein
MAKKKEEVKEVEVPKEPEVLEDSDRDALYANYEESENTPPTDEQPEDAPEEVIPEEYPEPTPEEVEEKPAEEKTVPHGAFHEEREKRKAAQKENEELKDQVKTLIKDNREFLEKFKAKEEDTEDIEIDDYDETLKSVIKQNKTLQAEIDILKQRESTRTETDVSREAQKQQDELNQQVLNVDKKLTEEGFPGFESLHIEVGQELSKLVAEDPDNVRLQNPEGWEKIYKEKVFPKYRKIFTGQDKSETFENKKNLKKNANLSGGGNKPDSEETKDEDWSYDDYIKNRAANSAV